MGRVTATLGGVLILALMAGVLTEAALARGHHGGLSDDAKLRPQSTASPSVTPSTPTPAPTTPAATTPKPTATPVPTPALKSAVTSSFVRMRAGKSTNTAILYELNGGTVVHVLPDADTQWQQVEYKGSVGYIYKTYLTY